MNIRVGTDIVLKERFKEKLEGNRWKFERDIFFEEEVAGNGSAEHLAGIFAAKEAAIKALDLAPGSWKSIKIEKLGSGRPILAFQNNLEHSIKSCDVSISHEGDYAIAVVVCIY